MSYIREWCQSNQTAQNLLGKEKVIEALEAVGDETADLPYVKATHLVDQGIKPAVAERIVAEIAQQMSDSKDFHDSNQSNDSDLCSDPSTPKCESKSSSFEPIPWYRFLEQLPSQRFCIPGYYEQSKNKANTLKRIWIGRQHEVYEALKYIWRTPYTDESDRLKQNKLIQAMGLFLDVSGHGEITEKSYMSPQELQELLIFV